MDIATITALAPDVIVQDLIFEGTQEQGWKVLSLAQLDPTLARIPLVLCTAAVRTVTNPEMAEQLDRQGIRVVLKPFDHRRPADHAERGPRRPGADQPSDRDVNRRRPRAVEDPARAGRLGSCQR